MPTYTAQRPRMTSLLEALSQLMEPADQALDEVADHDAALPRCPHCGSCQTRFSASILDTPYRNADGQLTRNIDCAPFAAFFKRRERGFATAAHRQRFLTKNARRFPSTAPNKPARSGRCARLPPSRGEALRPSGSFHRLRDEKRLVCCNSPASLPESRPIPDPPPIFDANGADERSASSIKADRRLLGVVWASQRRATLSSSTSVQ